jgi:TRAP-type C4-dicarboxylate transport system permease small subunit
MNVLAKLYLIIIGVLTGIAAGVLSAMMFLIMTDVILRYVFNSPIVGSYEIVQYMMTVLVSFAVVYCGYKRSHVSVDIVFDQLPPRPRSIVAFLGSLIVLILFILIARENVLYIKETYDQKLTSTILYIPTFPFVAAVAIGFVAFCLVIFVEFFNSLRGVVKK